MLNYVFLLAGGARGWCSWTHLLVRCCI